MKLRRRTLCVLLCGLFVVFGGLLAAPRAFAGSDYGVQLTDQLHIGGTGAPQTCYEDGTDMALEWGQIMQDNNGSATPYSYQNTWNWETNYTNPQGDTAHYDLTEFVMRFRTSLQAGTGWAVSQASEFDVYNTSQPEFKSFHKMIRIWAFDPDTTFTVQAGELVASKSIFYTDYFLNPNAGCRWQAWNQREVEKTLISFSSNELLFVNAQSITYPADYTGQPIPASYTPPVPTYVAMGDSFSSGEGNPPFEAGSDTSSDSCHRSPQAYPRLLEFYSTLDLSPTDFVACSGATTDDVINGKNGEPSQLDALSTDTRIVTMTIGGNNIKFSDFATACYDENDSCVPSSSAYQESWNIMTDTTRSDYLPSKLATLFGDISDHLGLNASVKVYVVGYPYLVTHDTWLDGSSAYCSYLSEGEASAAENLVYELDSVIHTAVTNFNDPRFVYVDPLASGSPFSGHELCTGSSYFNGIEKAGAFGGNDAYVFHPNEDGQQAYAGLLVDNVN